MFHRFFICLRISSVDFEISTDSLMLFLRFQVKTNLKPSRKYLNIRTIFFEHSITKSNKTKYSVV